ncbi:MAG: quinone oxidoreductase [Gemmatimonadota bacterium]|nr:quinone oxidoreductase [Gemmatimonadota bacterium]
MKAIQVRQPGGPEALEYVDVPQPEPGTGQAVVRIEAAGINFIDIYHRTGLYPLPIPFTPGSEGAGVVEAVGPGVTEVQVGDRVAFFHPGSYAERAVVPAAKLVPVPAGIDARTAAAALLQGLTAHYLTASTFPLKGGEKILIHAAAGGVGGILTQMAKARGAWVFATASTSKLDVVREYGADRVIDYTTEDFRSIILDETASTGLDVVYDSVGQSTFNGSLDCVRTRGTLVMYGQSSGPVPPVDLLSLSRKSIYLTRPTLGHYVATREELLWRSRELFDDILSGAVRIRIDQELSLGEADEAHRLLEGRQTVGKLILIP